MAIQEAINQAIGNVSQAIAIPKLIKGVNDDSQVSPEKEQFQAQKEKYQQDKLKFQQRKLQQQKREFRAHTKDWKAKQAIKAESEADMQMRLEAKREQRKAQNEQKSIYLGGQQISPNDPIYEKLRKAGEDNVNK